MRYSRSLRARLSLLFLAIFATIAILGLASAWSLRNSNEVSMDVRDRWLPDTRLLGDLNNYSSDYRTAEADTLIAQNSKELAEALHDIEELDQEVTRAQRGYEQLPHNRQETELYREFSMTWAAYKTLASQVTKLVSSGHAAEAAELYRNASRTTYNSASDTLGRLTDYNVMRASQASEHSAHAYREARWVLGGALVISAAMLTSVILLIRRSVSHPLLELGDAMRQLAANDTGVKVAHTDREDEIGEMARAVVVFRGNAIALIQSQQNLAQHASMLEEKLAHEQYLAELQRNFVSTISHEFRTPLTHIDAQAQRLIGLKDRLCGEDLVERARHIRAAVHRVIRLIDNLLESARIVDSDAKLHFHEEAVNIVSVLREVCRIHRETVPTAIISEQYTAEYLLVPGDPKMLFQSFSNLVANAIKYSRGSPLVKVEATQRRASISIVVTDQGVGIPEGDIPHIFTRYYRGSNVSGVTGTGVGLFLVATVVNLHAGSVTVRSKEDEGSQFEVTLPSAAVAKVPNCLSDSEFRAG